MLGSGKKRRAFADVPAGDVLAFACERAELPLGLWDGFAEKLAEQELWELFEELETPLIPVLADMEMNGVGIDASFFAEMSRRLAGELDRSPCVFSAGRPRSRSPCGSARTRRRPRTRDWSGSCEASHRPGAPDHAAPERPYLNAGELHSLLPEPEEDLPDASQLLELLEYEPDARPDPPVRVQLAPVVPGLEEPAWEEGMELSALRLLAQGHQRPLAHDPQLSLAHGALEAQQQPVVEVVRDRTPLRRR